MFEYDGVLYGVEVKNTLDYIPVEELNVKLEMCDFLGFKPLFIMRYAPKSYMKKIIDAGETSLGLKVDCPTRIADGTMERLVKAHQWQKGRKGGA